MLKSFISDQVYENVFVNMARKNRKQVTHDFERISISECSLITRDRLFQQFINVGYSFSLVQQWYDNLLFVYGCFQKPIYRSVTWGTPMEGIDKYQLGKFFHDYTLLKNRQYRTRSLNPIFDRLFGPINPGWYGNITVYNWIDFCDSKSDAFDYDMDEIKKSRVTGTKLIDSRAMRMIQGVNRGGRIYRDDFYWVMAGTTVPYTLQVYNRL